MPIFLALSMVLLSKVLAGTADPPSFRDTGLVCRITKPAALHLNEQTSQVIQAAFQHADYPDIEGEKSMRFVGKIAYGLTNIHVNSLSIESSSVDFREDDAIAIEIQNVSASFKGTLTYGFVGTWLVKLLHAIEFEINSSIDLLINTKLSCDHGRVVVDTSDCYLTFHKLVLHLQGDKNPGWLKRLFTNVISFTLKLVMKNQVCKEINVIAQMLADLFQDTAANFLQDGDIGVDVSLISSPVIQATYLESHHKGLLLYKNYSAVFRDSAFTPSLLSESRMLHFWFSDHVLNSLALAAFLDQRLELMITGEELQEIFESEELEIHRDIVQEIFQGTPYNDSRAKVWSLEPPQIALQPEGTVVKSSVAVELVVSSQGEEPSTVLYFEKDVTALIQASYVQKRLTLLQSHAMIEPRRFKFSPDIAVNEETLRDILEKIITITGIPKVVSRIEAAVTSLMNSKGLHRSDIINPEIITEKGYFIVQMDFDLPHHLLRDFLKRTL
ncbi:cholesteryl ester transfer protein [Pogona vitticeps]